MEFMNHPDKEKHLQYILSCFERENIYGGIYEKVKDNSNISTTIS